MTPAAIGLLVLYILGVVLMGGIAVDKDESIDGWRLAWIAFIWPIVVVWAMIGATVDPR